LRRQAVHAAGLAQHDRVERYRFDVTDPRCLIPERHRVGLALMLDQVSVLRVILAAQDPWWALLGAFPRLWELESRAEDWGAVGGPGAPATTLVGMYRAYVQEWERFPVVPIRRWGASDMAEAGA
jgi:hypothetical protein